MIWENGLLEAILKHKVEFEDNVLFFEKLGDWTMERIERIAVTLS